jgi:D-alanine-D-alanine ligase
MKITILTYLDSEDQKEVDPVVKQVASALRASGHTVSTLGVHGDLDKLMRGLKRRKPDLVFNMMEMFGDDATADYPIAAVMDVMKIRYTGSSPQELILTQDKVLAKKVLAFEGIQFPRFAVFSTAAALETGGNLRFPLFVKPSRMDASIGIGKKSLVNDMTTLMKRVVSIHEELDDAALAEEYIEGREFYVGVLGIGELQALPPIEMDFSGLPDGAPRVADAAAKWDESSKEFKGTRAVLAQLPDELRARLQKVSIDAYRALHVKDYGRVDLRLTDTGEIYVLEVNASCYLEKDAEFAVAARAAGIEYKDLVQKIVDLAMARYTRKK